MEFNEKTAISTGAASGMGLCSQRNLGGFRRKCRYVRCKREGT